MDRRFHLLEQGQGGFGVFAQTAASRPWVDWRAGRVDARRLVGRRPVGARPEGPLLVIPDLPCPQRPMSGGERQLRLVRQGAHLAGLQKRALHL